MVGGIGFNLLLLGYFKYANFFLDNINEVFRLDLVPLDIVLPLAISFFTFQQIAYLVDVYRRETKARSFLHYSVFVLFFPQLIAGPIVLHKEMIQQFLVSQMSSKIVKDLFVGLSIFFLGLFKKVIFAASCSVLADPVFLAAESGQIIGFWEAWGGVLAFSFQIYFDFSAYSDMAIGLARMFGIKLPENFASPYKAASIIDFWRRWHITLSRFLRDYLYIQLGGNRYGVLCRYRNLFITMLLGGLWHGASWTFVAWGALHGIFLAVNHAWLKVKMIIGLPDGLQRTRIFMSRVLTFVLVAFSWVLFRSETWDGARQISSGMLAVNGVALPPKIHAMWPFLDAYFSTSSSWIGSFSVEWGGLGFVWLFFLLAFCWYAPNTQEFMRDVSPVLSEYNKRNTMVNSRWLWRPNLNNGIIIGFVAMLTALFYLTATPSEFIYFRF